MVSTEKPRSTIGIYRDVLAVTAKEGNAKPTRILQGANLPYDRLMKHISELQKRRLLEEVSDAGGRYYRITPKGVKFLQEVRRAENFLSAFDVSL